MDGASKPQRQRLSTSATPQRSTPARGVSLISFTTPTPDEEQEHAARPIRRSHSDRIYRRRMFVRLL